ncbi:hypothetical protein ABK040_004747 [Willaertia magna]
MKLPILQNKEDLIFPIHHYCQALPYSIVIKHIIPFIDPNDLLFGFLNLWERTLISHQSFETLYKPLTSLLKNNNKTDFNNKKFKQNLNAIKPKLSDFEKSDRFFNYFNHLVLPSLRFTFLTTMIPKSYTMDQVKKLYFEEKKQQQEKEEATNLKLFLECIEYVYQREDELNLSSTTMNRFLQLQYGNIKALKVFIKYMKRILYNWRCLTFSITDLPNYMKEINIIENIRWNVCLSLDENIHWESLHSASQSYSNNKDVIILTGRLVDNITYHQLMEINSLLTLRKQSLIQLCFSKVKLSKILQRLMKEYSNNEDDNIRIDPNDVENLLSSFFQTRISYLDTICRDPTKQKQSSSSEPIFEYSSIIPKWIQTFGKLTILNSSHTSYDKLYRIDVDNFELLEHVRENQIISKKSDIIIENVKHVKNNPEKIYSNYTGSLIHCKEATVLEIDKRDNKRLTFILEPKSSQKFTENVFDKFKNLFIEFKPNDILESKQKQKENKFITLYHIHPRRLQEYNLRWPSLSGIGQVRPIKFLIKPGDIIQFKARMLNRNQMLGYEIRLVSPYLYISTPKEFLTQFLYRVPFLSLAGYLFYKMIYLEYVRARMEYPTTFAQHLAYNYTQALLKFQVGMIAFYLFVNWPNKMLALVSRLIGFKDVKSEIPKLGSVAGRINENIWALILVFFLIESRKQDASVLHKESARLIMEYGTWLGQWYLIFFGLKKGYEMLPFLMSSGGRVLHYVRQKVYQVRRFFIDYFFNDK